MPHHFFHHGQPVPPPLPPRNPIQNHAPQGYPAKGTPHDFSAPGHIHRPGTASGSGDGNSVPSSAAAAGPFPRPPMSPNTRPHQYPPPPPGPPPGQPGYFSLPLPPLPPRPATSSPHLGPRHPGSVYSPPATSPTTPGSAGFSLPPPPPRSPQPYSYTPSGHNQNSRMTLQSETRTSSTPSSPYHTPQETPLSSTAPASPPPPYSAGIPSETPSAYRPAPAQEPLRASSVGSIPQRVPSPLSSNSAPISPLPQPTRMESIRIRPSPSLRAGSTGSRTPITPSAASDNLDALLQSLSDEFRIPSPATSTFPAEDLSDNRAESSSPPPTTVPAPLGPRRSPRPYQGSFEAGSRPAAAKHDSSSFASNGQRTASSPLSRTNMGTVSPPPSSLPYPVEDDRTPAQPPLPLFVERVSHSLLDETTEQPKAFKAYRPPQVEEASETESAANAPKRFQSYRPDATKTEPREEPGPTEPTLATPPKTKSSFGPLRPVTMLFDPYQQQRVATAHEPPAVPRCIDSPVTFATDWYWHPDVPEYLVCSRCYVDHIFKTKFRSFFDSKHLEDNGTARVCSFGHPRMRKHLFQRAVSSGSMNEALDWMQMRATIPHCRGMAGVRGSDAAGLIWYKPRHRDAIPGFICCQACFEDRIMCIPRFAEGEFVQSEPQQAQDHWGCDFASPYMQREYEKCVDLETVSESASHATWQNFCQKARARLSMPLCASYQVMSTYHRTWYVPSDDKLHDIVLCQACYCDNVITSGAESHWRIAPELSEDANSRLVRCAMGMPNLRTGMQRAADLQDFKTLWAIAGQVLDELFCSPSGITHGNWYRLKPTGEARGQEQQPADFRVCGACRVGIFDVLQLSDVLESVTETASDASPLLCSLNPYHSRSASHLALIYEAFLTRSASSLSLYAEDYASILPCPRDNPEVMKQQSQQQESARKWYGWYDCTICPECYHDFVVRGGHASLTSGMELHNQPLQDSNINDNDDGEFTNNNAAAMCELYSPRMRNLFASCARVSPPDPTALLHFSSAQRRVVYMETVPRIVDILSMITTGLDSKNHNSNNRQHTAAVPFSRSSRGGGLHQVTSQFQYPPPPTAAAPKAGSGGLGSANQPRKAARPPVLPPAMLAPAPAGYGFAYRELLLAAQHDRQLWGTVLDRTTGQGLNQGYRQGHSQGQNQPPHVVLGELERRWRSVE
ncbi:hypothetical protein MN608_08656 [Microdochium nivale]|nr:hypothetical protein MN608_08656 [Microdochium nivale]